ncbi:P-loop containing nucleoside triphosphate hydrolase protein [Lasiosphaeria hispida]|uniref:P-loop containing nucleoside triphosphate hydrolase protein n=1 Tax=Lasiosphaeria hispida TaxID=260671 RepID=A0AAJ0MHV2_9PEZI|nr:P-loop containing nucleoside triphosphate hydrolase protein [Lasiosphaeria hispida]
MMSSSGVRPDQSSCEQARGGARHKVLIQMSGAPGSGKSTTAGLVGQSIGAVVIDHDIIKSTLLADDSIPFEQAAKSAYRLGWALVGTLMRQGWSVILDSTCNYKETLETGMKLAGDHSYEYWYIECRIDDIGVLDERLRKRAPLRSQRAGVHRPPSDATDTLEDPVALFKRWVENPCRPEEGSDTRIIIVDSTRGPEECREQIMERILKGGTKT